MQMPRPATNWPAHRRGWEGAMATVNSPTMESSKETQLPVWRVQRKETRERRENRTASESQSAGSGGQDCMTHLDAMCTNEESTWHVARELAQPIRRVCSTNRITPQPQLHLGNVCQHQGRLWSKQCAPQTSDCKSEPCLCIAKCRVHVTIDLVSPIKSEGR